jgi:hypothetical protein
MISTMADSGTPASAILVLCHRLRQAPHSTGAKPPSGEPKMVWTFTCSGSTPRARVVRLRPTMPCFLLLIVLLFPRVALALMWFFSTYLQRAFHGGLLLPVLGFIFLPLTTIVYAWELNSGMPTSGVNLVWLLLAVIVDLGGLGGGAHRQSRR